MADDDDEGDEIDNGERQRGVEKFLIYITLLLHDAWHCMYVT